MRFIIALITVSFAAVLSAQSVSVNVIIHEPSANDVGPFIAAITIPNPDFAPNNGEPVRVPLYGNGKGLERVDRVSKELYALGGTTTHDLIIITNTSGANITIDGDMTNPTYGLGLPRPKHDFAQAPEAGQPGWLNPPSFTPVDNTSILINTGASGAAFLMITRWNDNLDTSPRDYIFPVFFEDTAAPGTPIEVEIPLTIPHTGNGAEANSCSVSKGGLPAGLVLVAGVTLVAIIRRRRVLRSN